MNKRILGTILGLIITLLGIGAGYLFSQDTEKSNSGLLGTSIILTTFGVFLLIFTLGKKTAETISAITAIDSSGTTKTTSEKSESDQKSLLQKNNNLLTEWTKTNETRDRLKLLQISANAKKSAE